MDWTIFARYAAPIITLFAGAFLSRYLERRPKLVSYLSHAGAVTLRKQGDQPQVTVHTHTLVIRNSGKEKAQNVRIGHNILPNYSVVPDVEHNEVNLPGGSIDISIPMLVPNEQVTVTYLYFPPLIWSEINTTVRSDEGFATILNVLPTPQAPKWLERVSAGLMLVGLTTVAYGFFELLSLTFASR